MNTPAPGTGISSHKRREESPRGEGRGGRGRQATEAGPGCSKGQRGSRQARHLLAGSVPQPLSFLPFQQKLLSVVSRGQSTGGAGTEQRGQRRTEGVFLGARVPTQLCHGCPHVRGQGRPRDTPMAGFVTHPPPLTASRSPSVRGQKARDADRMQARMRGCDLFRRHCDYQPTLTLF